MIMYTHICTHNLIVLFEVNMFLVSFVGLNGCGKTTQATLLRDRLKRDGFNSIKLKSIPEDQRELYLQLMDSNSVEANHFLFCMLYQKQVDEIQKYLSKGFVVITDRFWESFATYHRQEGLIFKGLSSLYYELENLIFAKTPISLGFYLNVPLNSSYSRIVERNRGDANYETSESFHHKTTFFEDLCIQDTWHAIDGTQPTETIHDYVFRQVINSLN